MQRTGTTGEQLNCTVQGTTRVYSYACAKQVKTTVTNFKDASRQVQDGNKAKYCLVKPK